MNRSELKYLSVGQLEQLIDLYYEGELSRIEESELRKVLAFTDLTSDEIELAKASMGLETAMRPHRTKRHSNVWQSMAVAASVALIVSVGWGLQRNNSACAIDLCQNEEVYIAGQRVADTELSRLLADRSYRENMAFMEQMLADQRRETAECRRMIEELQNMNLQK